MMASSRVCTMKFEPPADPLRAAASASRDAAAHGPRIEHCEFDQLLQRAMEILNQRHLDAQLKATSSGDTPE
jgi:hypothetical protein